MNTPAPVSCRLAIKIARAAPVAVVLRRGPAQWVQMVRWDLRRDCFEFGQWFKGRIYEDCCDLSDDGELFVYHARKRRRFDMKAANGVGPVWTAVSRPPFFTALALWPYEGNGGPPRFMGKRQVALDLWGDLQRAHPGFPPLELDVCHILDADYSDNWFNGLGDGWERVSAPQPFESRAVGIWRISRGDGKAALECCRQMLRDPCRAPRLAKRYCLITAQGSEDLGLADFADFDDRGRLLLGRQGAISVCAAPWQLPLRWSTLLDLTQQTPQELEPPRWALRWPWRAVRHPVANRCRHGGAFVREGR